MCFILLVALCFRPKSKPKHAVGMSSVGFSEGGFSHASTAGSGPRADRGRHTALLDCLMVQPPAALEALFLLLEALQWMAFPWAASVPWTNPVQCVLLVTHVPVWDRTGACVPYGDQTLMILQMTAVVAVSVPSAFALVARLRRPTENEYWALTMKIVACALYVQARPLFVPLLRIALEGGWRRSWVEGMLGFIGAVLLTMWALLYRGVLIECLPSARCLSPLSQGRVHVGLAVGHIVVAVLMASTIPEVPQVCRACGACSASFTGGSTRSLKFFLGTALKDRPGPPTATNRQPPTAANHHQPPPTATNRQPPTAANHHQPPTANRCQPPPTATRQPPTANLWSREGPMTRKH